MLGLAGGVALEKRCAPVLQPVEHGLVELGGVGHGDLRHKRGPVSAGERLGHTLLLDQLALGRTAELVHVVTPKHGRAVGILSARVGVHLRVEHEQLHVGTVLEDNLGHVLEPNVPQRTIPADHPDFGKLTNFLIGHERVVHVGVPEVFGRADDVLLAIQ